VGAGNQSLPVLGRTGVVGTGISLVSGAGAGELAVDFAGGAGFSWETAGFSSEAAGFSVCAGGAATGPAPDELVFLALSGDPEHPDVTATTVPRIKARKRNDPEKSNGIRCLLRKKMRLNKKV
jgi:hypothetical protein